MNSKYSEPIFFLCNDPERALGLEDILENFHIICIDNTPIVQVARSRGINIFSLAESEGKTNPVYRSTVNLLKSIKVHNYIRENTPKDDNVNVMVFKTSLRIEKMCKEFGYNLLNTTSALNKKFELKISQYNSLNNLISFFPKTVITPLNKINYHELKKQLGEKFVIQYNRGHTGNSTKFIKNEEEYKAEREKYPNRLARIAEFIEGEIYTMNMCVTRYGPAYGGLSYQITGIEELTSREGGTIGNDWLYPQKLGEKVHNQIKEIISRIQTSLYDSGYRGLLGIDIIVTNKQKVYLIEINARQPASTSMHTKLMLHEEFIPLQAFHIAEFMFPEEGKYIRFLNKYFKKGLSENNISKFLEEQNKLATIPVEASQLIFRNTYSKRRKIEENVEQGIYVFNNKLLVKTNEGYNISDTIPGEYLILTTKRNQLVSPDNEVARIQTLDTILTKEGRLKSIPKRIIKKIQNNVKLI